MELKSDFAEAYNNLSNVLSGQGNWKEAVACCRRAIELKPELPEAHNGLGIAFLLQGNLDEAAGCFRRAVELKPDYAEAHNNLGAAWKARGDLDQAAACYRRALDVKPDFAEAHSNLLFALQYRADITLPQLAAAHSEFDRAHAAPLRAAWRPHANVRDPERRLRVGFVSPDFGRHPVGFFLIGLLEHLDRGRYETVCYCDRKIKDDLTARFQAAAALWRDAIGMSDEQLAEQIRADRIDVLFDLAGHTADNRLLAFARKPAPIQIGWIGYSATTGLSAMDYILADRFVIPPESETHYCERVLRMPDDYLCLESPGEAPPVSALPATANGFATFAAFHNPPKITPQVVEVWARLLERVPDARLLLKYRGMDDPSSASRLAGAMAGRGIDPARLEFRGFSAHRERFADYHRVDVALDTFPYNGCTTTCESLWMGVPVVTLPGETFGSRCSLSHLSSVGLAEMVARDVDQYVEIAAALAGDLPRLAALRAGLRGGWPFRRCAMASGLPRTSRKSSAASGGNGARRGSRQQAVRSRLRLSAALSTSAYHDPETRRMATIPEALTIAVEHHQAGRWQAAEQVYRQVLAVEPAQADAWNLLGVLHAQLGRHAAGVDCLRRAVALRPDWVRRPLQPRQGPPGTGEARRGGRLLPSDPGVEAGLRGGAQQLGPGPDRAGQMARSRGLLPPPPRTASRRRRRAQQPRPRLAGPRQAGPGRRLLPRSPAAATGLRRRAEQPRQRPHQPGKARGSRGLLPPGPRTPAQRRRGTQQSKRRPSGNGGLDRGGRFLPPGHRAGAYASEIHNNLGLALKRQEKLDAAVASYRRAVELNPRDAEALCNLGNVFGDQGRLDEAVASYRRALEIKPDYAAAHSNLLFALQYRPGVTPAGLFDAHAEYDRMHAAPLRALRRPRDDLRERTPSDEGARPLRVGFVSPDFGRHPVGYLLVRALENLDPEQCETVCYSDRLMQDDLAARFHAAAATWRNVVGVSDEQLAEQIRGDRIDVLFDLAGHTARNRLRHVRPQAGADPNHLARLRGDHRTGSDGLHPCRPLHDPGGQGVFLSRAGAANARRLRLLRSARGRARAGARCRRSKTASSASAASITWRKSTPGWSRSGRKSSAACRNPG